MGKRKIAYTVDAEKGTIKFTFGPGPDETVVFDTNDVKDEEIRKMAMLHGFKQKCVDAFADAKNRPEGQSVEAFKADQVSQRITMFINGDWTLKGEGVVRISMYAIALSELTGKSESESAEAWAAMDDDTKAKLKVHPKFAAIVTRIKMERERAKLAVLEANQPDDVPDISDIIG